MIQIKKGEGPNSLQTYAARGYRYDEHNTFSSIKQEIREHLCQEQGFICCFCMRRITPTEKLVQIAHIKNQAQNPKPELTCSYLNMLGSCSDPETCNHAQGNRDLKLSPSDSRKDIEEWVSYETDGTIRSKDKVFSKQIDEWVNLNKTLLRRNREEIYKRLRTLWRDAKDAKSKQSNLRKALHYWQGKESGKRPEYCGVAFYFLGRKLN